MAGEGAPPECRVEALDWTREGSVAAEVAGRRRNEPSVPEIGREEEEPELSLRSHCELRKSRPQCGVRAPGGGAFSLCLGDGSRARVLPHGSTFQKALSS